jgi:hypothetical protein
MIFYPQRTALLLRHIAAILLLIPVIALSSYRLFWFLPDGLAAVGLILLVVALIVLPAVVSRLLLLLSVRYAFTTGGAFEIRFGTRYERIPVEAVEEIRSGGKIPAGLQARAPGWWYSWSGRIFLKGLEKPIDWLATQSDEHLLLIVLKDRMLAISPADPVLFMRGFSNWATHASMDPVETVSIEPPALLMDILDHAAPTSLLLIGLAAVTGLGAFILGMQPVLPPVMPFKFSVAGAPIAPGSPMRLIILPIAGGIVWLVNTGIGWFGWRRDDRAAAYILWGSAMIVQIGLWFATIGLILNK